MSDLDSYLETNYGEPKSKEAPCCGATSPRDHDFECRFMKTQIDLPEWSGATDAEMGTTDEKGNFTMYNEPSPDNDGRSILHIGPDEHPTRQIPEYLSRGLAPNAKQTATELYGAAEADRLFPETEMVEPTGPIPSDSRPSDYGAIPVTRKVAYWMPSGAQVPFDAVVQLTVRVPIAREPLSDDERDLVFRSAVRKINDDVANLDGTVGYTILRTEPAVSPLDCGCTACTWFRDGFGDNVHGRACTNTDGATRLCEHTGCTCLSAMTDGECEACWLWSK